MHATEVSKRCSCITRELRQLLAGEVDAILNEAITEHRYLYAVGGIEVRVDVKVARSIDTRNKF